MADVTGMRDKPTWAKVLVASGMLGVVALAMYAIHLESKYGR